MNPELFTIPIIDWPVKSYGAMMTLGFLSGVWLAMRRAERVKTDPEVMLNVGFICLVCGVLGARIFYVIHYWESSFAKTDNPLFSALDCTGGGLEYYGGLIGAIVGTTIYLWWQKVSIRLALDILAPSAAWGLAFGRMGCLLNGCCWGGVAVDAQNNATIPWAIQFPIGSGAQVRQWDNRQMDLPAELIVANPRAYSEVVPLYHELIEMSPEKRLKPEQVVRDLDRQIEDMKTLGASKEDIDKLERQRAKARDKLKKHERKLYALDQALRFPSREDPSRAMTQTELESLSEKFRSRPVHPSQIYGIANGLLLSWLLVELFHRRKRHGVVFATLCIIYPITRTILEVIRVDNPHDTATLTISQAVSVGMFIFGIALLLYLRRLPMRSPRAVVWTPPEVEEEAKAE